MGNKQSSVDLFKQDQPRNVFSLYGPKTSSSSSPTTSMQSSVSNDTSICQLEYQKKQLRLSRAQRNTRSDGFKHHDNPESLVKTINFITKFLHIETTIEINTSILSEEVIRNEIQDGLYAAEEQQGVIIGEGDDEIKKNGSNQNFDIEEDYSLGTSVVQIRSQNSKKRQQSLKNQMEGHANVDGIYRPTAYFGNTDKIDSNQQQEEIPSLVKKDTFGELGGIQIKNQQSFEDPDFAAVPCRQTAFFGDVERQSQLRGFYKQLAQKQFYQDELYQNTVTFKQEEVKEEEENEQESGDEQQSTYKMNQYYQEQRDNQYKNDIDISKKQKQQEDHALDQDDEDDQPVHITIDLSAKKKKGRTQMGNQKDKPLVVNISSEKSRSQLQNNSSKSPKASQQSTLKPAWKPTSPHLISSTGSNGDKSPTKVDVNKTSKSPIRIDDQKERKKSASFLVINRQEKNLREKNKSQDFSKEILSIDSKIDKLNSEIEVIDLIKKDIAKVQNKIIKDMSPSYRQNQNKQN